MHRVPGAGPAPEAVRQAGAGGGDWGAARGAHHRHHGALRYCREGRLAGWGTDLWVGLRRFVLCLKWKIVHRCRVFGTPSLPPSALLAGAGKTTLLNTLAGKAQAYGSQSGSIFVNGRPDRLERYKRVMGFVPQVGPLLAPVCRYQLWRWCSWLRAEGADVC